VLGARAPATVEDAVKIRTWAIVAVVGVAAAVERPPTFRAYARLIGYANPGRTFTDTQEAWALNWRHWSGHGWLKAEHTTRAGNCLS
jgi:hypothetical protein